MTGTTTETGATTTTTGTALLAMESMTTKTTTTTITTAKKKQKHSQDDSPAIISTVTTTTANAMDFCHHGAEDEMRTDNNENNGDGTITKLTTMAEMETMETAMMEMATTETASSLLGGGTVTVPISQQLSKQDAVFPSATTGSVSMGTAMAEMETMEKHIINDDSENKEAANYGDGASNDRLDEDYNNNNHNLSYGTSNEDENLDLPHEDDDDKTNNMTIAKALLSLRGTVGATTATSQVTSSGGGDDMGGRGGGAAGEEEGGRAGCPRPVAKEPVPNWAGPRCRRCGR